MIEHTILTNLLYNEEFARKTIPFIKEEYFNNDNERKVFSLIDNYVKKYNSFPTKEALYIDLNNTNDCNEESFKQCKEIISSLEISEPSTIEWLLDQTEHFCQDRAIYNAIMSSIKILNDKTGNLAKGSIPKILSDALAVSFDTAIGHDFLEDFLSRYDFYHTVEKKIEFDLELFNKITKGGISRKTLTVALAGTGVGKTLFMCHCAASNLSSGYNVLYITLEMSQEKIAERIDANLLDVAIDELAIIPKESYEKKINRVKQKTTGRLIIKEYPTASASSANFRHLLNELKIKKNFIPHIIYVDYINICSSARIKQTANFNSYTYIKAIAEELRGLAVEFDVPIVTATQTNRSGFSNSDPGLENTSESFGLPATADIMFALVTTEELEKLGQIMVKQLKNRYSDPSTYKRFVIGVDKVKMKLYDVEQIAQEGLVDDVPVMNNSEFGMRIENDEMSNKFNKIRNKFKEFET